MHPPKCSEGRTPLPMGPGPTLLWDWAAVGTAEEGTVRPSTYPATVGATAAEMSGCRIRGVSQGTWASSHLGNLTPFPGWNGAGRLIYVLPEGLGHRASPNSWPIK